MLPFLIPRTPRSPKPVGQWSAQWTELLFASEYEVSSPLGKVEFVVCVLMSSLQVGDVALFMTDAHGNYLALSVDGKTYYLNHSCVSSFSQYLSSKGKREGGSF